MFMESRSTNKVRRISSEQKTDRPLTDRQAGSKEEHRQSMGRAATCEAIIQ